MSEYVLEMKGITKEFPGVKALNGVNFNLKAGEIHCLIGENGAGKSTLIKCLGGNHTPTSGQIFVDGQEIVIANPQIARDKQIGVIYQEFNLVPAFTIAENIYLGRELSKGLLIDRETMYQESDKVLAKLGQDGIMNAKMRVFELPTSKQQMVEISKAIANDAKIMVFDEPTAVLTQKETDDLFKIIAQLKAQGVGIIYITHRLDEVLLLADRVTGLRDGEITGTVDKTPELTKDDLVAMMIGRKLDAFYPARKTQPEDEVVFELKGFNNEKLWHNVDLQLHHKEILGLCGLVGAGRTETFKGVFGLLPHDGGEVYVKGEKMTEFTPLAYIKKGMALLPEDRKTEGLSLMQTAAQNLVIPNYDLVAKKNGIFIDFKKMDEFIDKYFNLLMVHPNLPDRLALNFSGGNQQKIIIAKWLARNPDILVMDEPTRGIDVNAKAEIYNIMNDLTVDGMSIIMISSEMAELMGVCDRIMVMYEGTIVDTFDRSEFVEDDIARAESGIKIHA